MIAKKSSRTKPTGNGSPDEKELDDGRDGTKKKGILLSLTSGFLAAMASLVAKLALDSHDISLVFRCFLMLLMVLVNSIMWTTYSKALDACESSVVASVLNTISNFTLTAIMGVVFFKEGYVLSLRWPSGMALILIGLCLILHENRQDQRNTKKRC